MDFTLPYTQEQENFRGEVRTWLEENIPDEMRDPIDRQDLTEEMYSWWRGTHQKLAAMGCHSDDQHKFVNKLLATGQFEKAARRLLK